MTKRSGLLAFMSVVLVGLALVSRAPGARPTPVITDTPIIVDLEETPAPIEATVTVGHTAEAETVPRYTEPDRAGVVAYVDGRFDDALSYSRRLSRTTHKTQSPSTTSVRFWPSSDATTKRSTASSRRSPSTHHGGPITSTSPTHSAKQVSGTKRLRSTKWPQRFPLPST